MFILTGLVAGPFRNETEFKGAVVRQLKTISATKDWFCIETEETEPGFPDVFGTYASSLPIFLEMKVADEAGRFRFKKSQPLFYRQHPNMRIHVLVWSKKHSEVFVYNADEIVTAKSLSFRILTNRLDRMAATSFIL